MTGDVYRDPLSWFALDGRVAVVTGGASGIGRATARVLSAAGARVVVVDLDGEGAMETASDIGSAGGIAVGCKVDVRSKADIAYALSAAKSKFGGLDILCNIAGAPAHTSPLVDASVKDVHREIDLTLVPLLHSCRAARHLLCASAHAAIVNVCSTSIDLPAAGSGVYHIGKLAVAGATRTLALELGADGIRVNAIAPGVTLTGFSSRHFSDADGRVDPQRKREWVDKMSSMSPLSMVGDPSDQALLVLYLVSDASRFVTGQIMRANGGWSMP